MNHHLCRQVKLPPLSQRIQNKAANGAFDLQMQWSGDRPIKYFTFHHSDGISCRHFISYRITRNTVYLVLFCSTNQVFALYPFVYLKKQNSQLVSNNSVAILLGLFYGLFEAASAEVRLTNAIIAVQLSISSHSALHSFLSGVKRRAWYIARKVMFPMLYFMIRYCRARSQPPFQMQWRTVLKSMFGSSAWIETKVE